MERSRPGKSARPVDLFDEVPTEVVCQDGSRVLYRDDLGFPLITPAAAESHSAEAFGLWLSKQAQLLQVARMLDVCRVLAQVRDQAQASGLVPYPDALRAHMAKWEARGLPYHHTIRDVLPHGHSLLQQYSVLYTQMWGHRRHLEGPDEGLFGAPVLRVHVWRGRRRSGPTWPNVDVHVVPFGLRDQLRPEQLRKLDLRLAKLHVGSAYNGTTNFEGWDGIVEALKGDASHVLATAALMDSDTMRKERDAFVDTLLRTEAPKAFKSFRVRRANVNLLSEFSGTVSGEVNVGSWSDQGRATKDAYAVALTLPADSPEAARQVARELLALLPPLTSSHWVVFAWPLVGLYQAADRWRFWVGIRAAPWERYWPVLAANRISLLSPGREDVDKPPYGQVLHVSQGNLGAH